MALQVRYLSNMGVCIESEHNKIFIDVLCVSSEAHFLGLSDEIQTDIINNAEPYDNIDIMLFTHKHDDHFNAPLVCNYITNRKNKDTKIIMTEQSKELLDKEHFFDEQSFGIIPIDIEVGKKDEIQLNGVKIKMYSMSHEGKLFNNIRNIVFLIEIDGKKILHTGDAAPSNENYDMFSAMFIEEEIDLLIAPFLYLNMEIGHRIIDERIKPKEVIITHVPTEEKDFFGFRSTCYRKIKIIDKSKRNISIIDEVGDVFCLN